MPSPLTGGSDRSAGTPKRAARPMVTPLPTLVPLSHSPHLADCAVLDGGRECDCDATGTV